MNVCIINVWGYTEILPNTALRDKTKAMESESGENVEYFWMLRKLLLVRFCFVVWIFFGVFSTFCMTSFSD